MEVSTPPPSHDYIFIIIYIFPVNGRKKIKWYFVYNDLNNSKIIGRRHRFDFPTAFTYSTRPYYKHAKRTDVALSIFT